MENPTFQDGIHLPNFELLLTLSAGWFCVYVVMRKGIRNINIISYPVVFLAYFMLFILLCFSIGKEGALDGLKHFVKFDWSHFLDMNVSVC